jgi:Fe-S-cluster containining protein
MEFTLNLALIRRIAREETTLAGEEIATSGPLAAYRNSLQRQDQLLQQAADAPTLACKAGCSWCCHFSVDARPVEIFNIVEFMEREFSAAEQQRLHTLFLNNSAQLRHLDEEQRMLQNLPCPFLAEGRCNIYAARPQTCRNYHATDATGCQQSYEHPDDMDIAPDYAPLVYQSGATHVDAFSKAMQDAGYDIAAYELNSALCEVIREPLASRQRFDTRLPAFVGLDSTDVPMEFMDTDDE